VTRRVERLAMTEPMMSIVYSSRASAGFDPSHLVDVLLHSRRNNRRLGLSGMLLYRAGIFLQVIEGPEAVLRERMAIIASDPRHDGVDVLLEEPIAERMFPAWTMGSGDAAGDSAPGLREAFEDLAAGRDMTASLPALRGIIRWFQVNAV
jgi:hypothetical protein